MFVHVNQPDDVFLFLQPQIDNILQNCCCPFHWLTLFKNTKRVNMSNNNNDNNILYIPLKKELKKYTNSRNRETIKNENFLTIQNRDMVHIKSHLY